jgi:hypothetical protein
MRVARLRSTTFELTLSAFELASLVAALRWAATGGQGELTAEAKAQMERVLASYDREWQRLPSASS